MSLPIPSITATYSPTDVGDTLQQRISQSFSGAGVITQSTGGGITTVLLGIAVLGLLYLLMRKSKS